MTQQRSPLTLSHIIERISGICPPRHRELTRGMVAELASIEDPAERKRFALGAIAAIARLAVRGYCQTITHALGLFVGVREPEYRSIVGGLPMQKITSPQLLRRHVIPFAVFFTLLTLLALARPAVRLVPGLSARGESVGTIVEALLLVVPYTVALTIPIAVLLSVSLVFTRLGAEGVLVPTLRERYGIRRLIFPVLGAAIVISTLTFFLNDQIIPRTNAQLRALFAGEQTPPRQRWKGDREMTIGELRERAGELREIAEERRKDPRYAESWSASIAHAVAYEVEIHKKFAISASCVVLALVGAAMALRFQRGGVWLVLGAGGVVFTGYYFSLVAGESLANQQLLSPFIAMWIANAFFLAIAVLLLWRLRRSDHTAGERSLAIEG